MHRVRKIEIRPPYRLAVTFEDGTFGEISLEHELDGPVFEPLRDPEFFAQARVDAFGAVCWPNSADLAPDALYETIISAKAG